MSLAKLLDRSFRTGPAPQANQLIDEVRRKTRAEFGAAINYEVVLMGRVFAYLQHDVAPKMALFLGTKRDGIRTAFVSLFVDETTLCFIRAADFFEVIRESLDLDPEAFQAVMEHWKRTGRPASALPGPEPS